MLTHEVPVFPSVRETRHSSNNIRAIHTRHTYFKNSFFPSTMSEWNIRNSGSLSIFKKDVLNFIRSCANSVFNINSPYGIKLSTRLQLGLSHIRDHKFRHCFQDTQNPLCDCGNDTETVTHFFLHCPSFHTSRQILLNNIRNINKQILPHDEDHLVKTFLYRNPSCNLTINRLIKCNN